MTRKLILAASLASVAGGALWLLRPAGPPPEEAYVGEREVIAWSRLAQVREAAAVLRYGERVGVLARRAGQAQIRTGQGSEGWVEARYLMDAAVWRRGEALRAETRAFPVQATAHTRVLTNVRTEPGRSSPRLFQFERDVAVEILRRAVAGWTPPAEEKPALEREAESPAASAGDPPFPSARAGETTEAEKTRSEDWLLVRARVENAGEITGWVLGRFLEPQMPDPLRDLGAGIRFLAWFELFRIPDIEGPKGQYLAAGVTGAEGQPCDFTLIRYYTWNAKRRRYETAMVESNFCASLPLRVTPATLPQNEARFEFAARSRRATQEVRVYTVRQNVVSRIRASRP